MKLTPNRRMAAFLQSKGDTDALPLNTWLEQWYAQLFQSARGYPYCLSVHEEEIIWEKIITQSELGQSLLRVSGFARLAKEAWYLCSEWQLPRNAVNNAINEDSRVYQNWALDYQSECRAKNWVDFANILEYLLDAVHQKHLVLPEEITLVGFEEFTPRLRVFLDNLQKRGCKVQFHSLILDKNGHINRLAAKDNEEEFRLAAAMANQWIEKTPNGLVGIVVPELEKQRSLVIRIFEEVCSAPFNVSAPLTLDCYPLIDAALSALSLLAEEILLEKFSRVLRSPFFGYGISQMSSKAVVDVDIRSFKEKEFSIEKLIKKMKYVTGTSSENLIWLKDLNKFLEQQVALQSKQSASHWKNVIVDLLKILGWPGERSLTGDEVQVQQQWEKLLELYVSMAPFFGDHHYREAIFQLGRLAKATAFLPASSSASVQILGVLEAAGLPFDYLWVTGLHREAWPLEPAPNPFIPIAVQRTYDLPRSSAVRELKVAKRFTEKFCKSAKQVIFSYPLVVEERASTASALITHLPEISKQTLGFSELLSSIPLMLTKKMTYPPFLVLAMQKKDRQDKAEQRLPIEMGGIVSGGASLLKLQALCPFRAFAEIRLRAYPLPEVKTGLDSKDRGEIVHDTLHFLWEKIPNQAVLQSFSAEELNDKIDKAFKKAIARWQKRYLINLAPRYLALEKKRTSELLHQLCELEKSRPYFEVVAREEERLIDLQGLQIKIRIDRIDKTQNQEEILIDYKTGQVSISNWFQDRPQDPQLPLYCISRDPKPMSIIFSILRPDGVRFQGLSREEKYLPGVKTVAQLKSLASEATWEEQCTAWQRALELLAKGFKEGVATVDPVDGENTCRTCSLMSLCRVKSLAFSSEIPLNSHVPSDQSIKKAI